MIAKLKDYIMNLPAKATIALLAIVFVLAIFASRWYSYQSRTIAQTMVLHHPEEKKLTKKEIQIISIERNRMKEFFGIFCPEINISKETEQTVKDSDYFN